MRGRGEVTKQQVTVWIQRLAQFQRPAAFLSIVQEAKSVPNDRFFNDPVYKPLQEAWAAGHFALGLEQLHGPTEVRLDPDRFPDFHIRLDGREHGFEFTTAEKPERRRGSEHKERERDPLLLTPYEPARGRQEGALWIAGAVRKKHEKHYSTLPHLLVYANFEADALEPLELADACRPWAAPFSSLWVLWSYQVVQVFDSGTFGNADLTWRSVRVDTWD